MTDAYQDTVRRMEPDVAHVDLTGAAGSIAISLRRIADAVTSGSLDWDIVRANVETIAYEAGRAFEAGRRQS